MPASFRGNAATFFLLMVSRLDVRAQKRRRQRRLVRRRQRGVFLVLLCLLQCVLKVVDRMRPTGRTLWIKPRESRWWDRMLAEASDTDWREFQDVKRNSHEVSI